ncbi:MAG: GNAT family N-acetyltransferase [candidate division SR1 bacterium]|nr:GNAT family N-acetyltransferase [candidate division SR1 bacterium]
MGNSIHKAKATSYNKIKNATEEDAEQISNIRVKARKEGYKGIISEKYLDTLTSSTERIQSYKNIIRMNANIFLVSERDGLIKGFIYGGEPRDRDEISSKEVYAFYVNPECQREGIGSQLFNEFCKKIRPRDVYLRTLSGSKGDAFYQKRGGIASGTKKIEIGGDIYKEIKYVFKTD